MEKSVKGVSIPDMDGSDLRIGIVHTRWNSEIVDELIKGCKEALQASNVKFVHIETVPGSYELPYGASRLIKSLNLDACICIGVLIKGSTLHFEYICEAVTQGIMRLGLDTGVPVLFGVLTCLTEEQAKERAGLTPNGHNHGIDWGKGAVEMGLMKRRTQSFQYGK
eukprot:Colp12_sorted_trinity150504_noHs@13545